jgi:predicted nucleic acid-binding Zn ribbon protein
VRDRFSPGKKKDDRPKGMVGAQALFDAVLRRLGYSHEHYAVFEIWDRLLGAQAAKARAVGLKGQKLCIEVDSSARLHDLSLKKRDLLRKINQHFGERRVISDIILELSGRREHAPGGVRPRA